MGTGRRSRVAGTEAGTMAEGELELAFHMAPPLLSRPKNGQPPKKWTLSGRWLRPALRLLAAACAAAARRRHLLRPHIVMRGA